MTKTQKLEKIRTLLEINGVASFDAEVLAEDVYAIANERGGSFQELSERLASLEQKHDVMNEKLSAVAKRLG